MWGFVQECDGLDNYLNTTMDKVHSDGSKIQSVECYQMSTEKRYEFTANVFIDCTGHGTLGYFAGAEYAIGTESIHTFNETIGPEIDNGDTMGNTVMFFAHDTGKPVEFVKPK